MKYVLRFSFVIAFVLSTMFSFSQGKSKLAFEKLNHDFGTFKESAGVQSSDFIFTNEGEVPLVINSVRASCGCTTPSWTREPVAPGQKGKISVSYNPKNRPGGFNKTITVQSNAENATVVLHITGRVEQKEKTIAELYPRQLGQLRVKRNQISFAKIKQTEVKTETLELVNDTDEPVSVAIKKSPGYIKATIEPATVPAKGKSIVKVTYDAKAKNAYGFVNDRIYLTIGGSNDYKNSIGVNATIEEDFSALTAEQLANAPVAVFETTTHDFGEINQGDVVKYSFTLRNDGKDDLVIRNVRSSCGCTAAAPAKKVIAAGETAPINVEFNSRGRKGKQSKSITIITNDPKTPTSSLRISSTINVKE